MEFILSSFILSKHEVIINGTKYLHKNGKLYTIRDRESDADYDVDEDWTFEVWCGPQANASAQLLFDRDISCQTSNPSDSREELVKAKMLDIQKKRMEESIEKEATKRLDYLSAKTYSELYSAIYKHEEKPKQYNCNHHNYPCGINGKDCWFEWAVKISKELIEKKMVSNELMMQHEIDNTVLVKDWDLIRTYSLQGNLYANRALIEHETHLEMLHKAEEAQKAREKELEQKTIIRTALKYAYNSYYAHVCAASIPDNHRYPDAKRHGRDQFKANQKILHNLGITPDTLKTYTLEGNDRCHYYYGSSGFKKYTQTVNLSFLLTANKTHAEKNPTYLTTGLPRPQYIIQWAE